MANDLFRNQLASYASVHRDWRNKATHFVGIPIIVFSLLLILSLWRFEVNDRQWTASLAVAVVAVLGWIALDVGVGVVMGLIMVMAWYAAERWLARWARRRPFGSPSPRCSSAAGRCNSLATTTRASVRRCWTTSSRPSSGRCSWSPRPWWSWASAAISPMPWAKVTSRRGEQG